MKKVNIEQLISGTSISGKKETKKKAGLYQKLDMNQNSQVIL